MLANRKRRRTRRKRAMPAGLKAYWANRRRVRRRRTAPKIRVRHAILTNPRHRRRHRRNPSGGGGVPSSAKGFISAGFLMQAGAVALGVMAPGYVTDRLLPMVGLTLTGIPRRLAQFAVPAVVVMLGGKKVLGKFSGPFVLGAAGATVLGLATDLTGGLVSAPMLGRYAPRPAVAGPAAGMLGRYSAQPKVLATR